MTEKFRQLDYKIWGSNRVSLSDEMEREIKDRFQKDRENRFQLFLLSSGLRNKYLDKKTNKYSDEFEKWFKSRGIENLYGSLSNFTKYCSCGDVVSYVGNKTNDPQKYLNQLPLSVGALYELSIVLKKDKDVFNILLHYTPKRKTVDEPKYQWITKRPSLIRPRVTEIEIRSWRQKWDNPPPPKQRRTDKRTLKFITITVNGELFDFDRRNGDKVGCVDLSDVEDFLTKIRSLINEDNQQKFKIVDEMDYLTEGYYRRKEQFDVTKNIKLGKKDTSTKYKND